MTELLITKAIECKTTTQAMFIAHKGSHWCDEAGEGESQGLA